MVTCVFICICAYLIPLYSFKRHRVLLLDNYLLLVDGFQASTTTMIRHVTTTMIRHVSLWRATTQCEASAIFQSLSLKIPRYLKRSACSCSTATFFFGQLLLHSVGTMHVFWQKQIEVQVVSCIPKQFFFPNRGIQLSTIPHAQVEMVQGEYSIYCTHRWLQEISMDQYMQNEPLIVKMLKFDIMKVAILPDLQYLGTCFRVWHSRMPMFVVYSFLLAQLFM